MAIDALTTKIAEAAEKKYPTEPRLEPYPPNRSPDGQFLVRLLIPRSSEGAMIGKGGVVVKQMTAETGCNFQLGDENDQYNTHERIFILTSPTVNGVVLGVNAVMHTLITSTKIRGYVNTGTSYGQAPSNQVGAPVPAQTAPYSGSNSGYAQAPVPAPTMVSYAPAPTVMYAPAPVVVGVPPQQVQYVQVPPQMAVPVQQVGAYPQPQPAFQQPLGGNYQYNQGQHHQQQNQGREPVRHAGGPNGRGAHGGAGGSNGQSQNQSQPQGGYNKNGNNYGNNHNRYQPQGAPAASHSQQPVYAQQVPVAYQQQPPQQQGMVAQYPVQHQQIQGQAPQQQQPQYLYPVQPVTGMPQQQQGKMPLPHTQPQQQQQPLVYGAQPVYQQQPQYAVYPTGYTATDPSHQQQVQYAVSVQQGAPHGYPPQQQQQYTQYGQQQHSQQPAGSSGAPQQYGYGAPIVRK